MVEGLAAACNDADMFGHAVDTVLVDLGAVHAICSESGMHYRCFHKP